jgi:hypothetical protein
MKLSTSLNVFDRSVPIEQAIERAVGAGFEALDFNFVDWCWGDSPFLAEDWE